MQEKPRMDENLLNRFFKGDCNQEETEVVLEWLANPENKLLARTFMQRRWNDLEPARKGAEINLDDLLGKIQKRISVAHRNQKKKSSAKALWRVAAVWTGVLLAASAAVFFVVRRDITISPLIRNQDQEIRTSSGQMLLEILPDGTKVWLNAQSSLTFPQSFSEKRTREVTLKGEAFFDVAESMAQPFIVKTTGVNIRVVGTAFNLKAYEGDPTIETTLVRGKVVIENKGKAGEKIVLKPNQKAVFSHSTEIITLVEVEEKKLVLWNSGSLVFEDEILYDVIKSLERWYGVTIHLQDQSNLGCRLTARIDKESLDETMKILKSLTGISYSIAEKEVFIEGKICEQ